MKFNCRQFCSYKLLHIINMMDIIIFNNTEYASHTSDDSGLFAMMNIISSDYMTSNFFFGPSMILSSADCISFHLCWTFNMVFGKVMIVLFVIIFSQ